MATNKRMAAALDAARAAVTAAGPMDSNRNYVETREQIRARVAAELEAERSAPAAEQEESR